MSVKIRHLSEQEIRMIGDAFGDYDYEENERGLAFLYKSTQDVSNYICGYVRSAIMAGTLYATSDKHEGFLSMRRSDSKQNLEAGLEILKSIPGGVDVKHGVQLAVGMKNNPKSYNTMLAKLKIPYIYVNMLAVTKPYQGQGYMRQTLEIAFEEGRKHGMPVVLDTDAVVKREKYEHLGMKWVVTQHIADGVEVYGLVYEPDELPEEWKSEAVLERYAVVTSKNQNVWDRYAKVYKTAVTGSKKNKRAYENMYRRIRKVAAGKEVLELAAGPGLISKEIAEVTKRMVATDYSEKMLEEARKGYIPEMLTFEQADASDLQYEDDSFDLVLIANALHIIPDSGKVLEEIKRVLKPGGILIAPNFIHDNASKSSNAASKALEKAGVTFEVEWDENAYRIFLEEHGFRVVNSYVFHAMIPLMYTESVMV